MVTLRKRTRTQETPAYPKQTLDHDTINNTTHTTKTTTEGSGYEQSREKRIKENMERMQKLGIFDLSLKIKSELVRPKRSPKTPYQRKTPIPVRSSLPPRRSSRLQDVTPVSYVEIREKKKSSKDEGPLIGEGNRPEVYTEEHDKLLGTCEASWTLFVDGYGKDGKRIYDPVNGKTCHQCRQKTMGHRTHCCKCNLVQGQFCGDCLYMRYGEHVLEVNQNPNWICPPCRGICNCSLCRQAKGWPATGSLYRKISSLGFKSVAHYLIQTYRSQTNSEEGEPSTNNPVSAKAEEDSDHKDSFIPENRQDESPNLQDKRDKVEKEDALGTYHPVSAKRSLTFKDLEKTSEVEALKLDFEDGVGNVETVAKGAELILAT